MRVRTCFRRTNDNSFRCGGLGRSRWMLVSTIGCCFFLDNIIAASFFTSSLTFFYFAIACFIFWTILLYFSENSSSASRILYTNSYLKDFCRMEVVFADIGVLCFVKKLASMWTRPTPCFLGGCSPSFVTLVIEVFPVYLY